MDLSEFATRGWTILQGALPSEAVTSFVNDVAEELETGHGRYDILPTAPAAAAPKKWVPTDMKPIRLADRSTWPSGNDRRVVEVAPNGDRDYWKALRQSEVLRAALDELAGPGCWELPTNEPASDGQMSTRHWYVPVTFPEWQATASRNTKPAPAAHLQVDRPSTGLRVDPAAPLRAPAWQNGQSAVGSHAPRVAVLGPAKPHLDAVLKLHGPNPDPADVWEVVSRRRVLSKGWHLDVGPGFPNEGPRTSAGDWRQGIVLLLLLSDCGPGEGGTAMISGSHTWMLQELLRAEASGSVHTHETSNLSAVRHLRTATEAGRVLLAPHGMSAPTGISDCTCGHASGDASASGLHCRVSSAGGPVHATPLEPGCNAKLWVEQVVGRAGDIVLVHPLLLHSGTTVMGQRPRLMANGVARYRHEAWEDPARLAGQCPVLKASRHALDSRMVDTGTARSMTTLSGSSGSSFAGGSSAVLTESRADMAAPGPLSVHSGLG